MIENTVLSSGSLCFDTASRIVTAAGHPVSLTTKENALLEYLLLHKGRVIKLEELIEHVWDSNADTFSNSVRVHMSSLRRKLKGQLGYAVAPAIFVMQKINDFLHGVPGADDLRLDFVSDARFHKNSSIFYLGVKA